MKDIEHLAMRIAPWVILLLTVGIFISDLLTPVGIALSVFYVIPLLLTLLTSRTRDPIHFCGLATILLWVGLFLKPPGSPLLYGVVNRTLGTSVLWIVALGLIRFKWMHQQVRDTGQELMVERAERAQAEGLVLAAREARAHADTAVLGAVASRREMEAQLLVSQLRLEVIIDSAMDAILTVDEDQRIVLFNRAAEQMFGRSIREAVGQTLDQFLPARFRDAHRHHVRTFGQSGVTNRKMGQLGTVMGLRSNGEEFPVEASISHITVEGTNYFTVILRDISERELAAQKLKEVGYRLRVATESVGIGVWDYSIPDNRLVWDDRMYALYGYHPGHFPDAYEAWSQRLHPEDKAQAERVLQEAIEGRQKFDTEFRLLLPDGTTRFIKADALVLRDAQGTPIRMIGVNSDITDRKEAEAALRETSEHLSLLMSNAPAALAMLDRDLRYLAVSQRWVTDYRLEGQALIGRSHYEVFPEIPDRWKAVHQRVLAGEIIRCEEDHFIRQDGSEQWLRWEVRPWYAEKGAVGGVVFFTEDITERKRGEEALSESQRQLTTLISNLPGFAYRCRNDRDWTFEYVSEGVSVLTGYTVEDYLVQRSISYGKNIHPDDRERVWQEVQAAVAQHSPFEQTYRVLTKSGEITWVWERGEGIYAPDGILTYLEGFVTDVTERKRAEHLLRQSEERYRRLVEVSPYAIFVSRGDRIIFANDQAIKLFGAVKADEILGKSRIDLFHPDYHAVIQEQIHELLEGRAQVPTIEEKIVGLDGTAIDVEVSAARFADEEGTAILVMLRDVSERKRLQDQLRKTERIAELGTLASGMAHEIGTPMNVILGRAEYLLERVSEEPIKKGLRTIISQVERITRVMNQLLSFARRKAPERVALDLKQVIEDGLEMFQERLARSQIQVVTELSDDCPLVQADGDQMSQVLINLVMNSVHAMPDGGTLRIGLLPENRMVKLTVGDSGHGIPRDVLKKVFEPFFTTKEFGQGTGLGLTVVKGIIEEHQGSITVESEEGKGTTFTILLPTAERTT